MFYTILYILIYHKAVFNKAVFYFKTPDPKPLWHTNNFEIRK